MEYIIRELKEDEYCMLREFTYQAIFNRDKNNSIPMAVLDEPQVKVYYEDFGRHDDNCLVIEADNRIIGAVWTRILSGAVKGFGNIDERTPEFGISLFEEYRGKGFGTKLMKSMLELLKQKGYNRTSLSVQKDNYAVNMYKNVGFSILKEKGEEYLMVCDLGMEKKYRDISINIGKNIAIFSLILAKISRYFCQFRQKYRDIFASLDKNIAIFLSALIKISRYFCRYKK